MPKLRSKPSAKKRFKFTASGKIKRRHACHSHILTKKAPDQKRRLDQGAIVCAVDERKIERLLPYGR